jgi:hypothetical protein
MKKRHARDIPDFSRHTPQKSEGKIVAPDAAKSANVPAPRPVPKQSTKSPSAGRRGQ